MKADAYGSLNIKILDSLIFNAKVVGSLTPFIQVVKDVLLCKGPRKQKEKCIFYTITSLRSTSAFIEESFSVDVDSFFQKAGPFAEWIEKIIFHNEQSVHPNR